MLFVSTFETVTADHKEMIARRIAEVVALVTN